MKWVCITDDLVDFTKGGIYEDDDPFGDSFLIELELTSLYNNKGYLVITPLYTIKEVANYKFERRYYGPSKIKKPNFMRLNDWRESQINKILEII